MKTPWRQSLSRLFIAVCWMPLAILPGPADTTESIDYAVAISELSQTIKRQMRQDKVVGASIALVDDQQVIWSQGFGQADRSQQIPATPETIYQAGDLSKIITAIAALQLAESGAFGLDSTLQELLPSAQLESRFESQVSPSLRQLLSHHSGLTINHWSSAYREQAQIGLAALPELTISQPTGEIYAYSNLAFEVIGHIVQRYRGRPFEQVISESILQPLQMNASGFDSADMAVGYNRKRQGQKIFPRDLASLGLLTSVSDVAEFVRWLFRDDTKPVLARPWLEQMQQLSNSGVELDLDNQTGLAWQLTNTGRHGTDKVLRINASTLDFRGIVLVAPKEKLGVVLFSNSSTATDLVIDVSRRALDLMLQDKAGIPAPDFDNDLPKVAPMRHGESDQLAPRYSTALGLIEFSGSSPRENVYLMGRKLAARQRTDGWYQLSYRLLGVLPLRFGVLRDILLRPAQLSGQRSLLVYYQHQEFLLGTQLADPRPQPTDLTQLTGRFALLNPDPLTRRLGIEQVLVSQQDGRLVASYQLPLTFKLHLQLPLEPLGQDRFFVPGLGSNLGDEIRFKPSPEGLLLNYSNYRFRRPTEFRK